MLIFCLEVACVHVAVCLRGKDEEPTLYCYPVGIRVCDGMSEKRFYVIFLSPSR